MTPQQVQRTLTMKPHLCVGSGLPLEQTVKSYIVFDEHGNEVAFITNKNESPAPWQISRRKDGKTEVFPGYYATAEEALAAIQGGSW